jgi:hypothetical protein
MPKASPIVASFNAGEWSPLLDGRTDVAKYSKACRHMDNFIPSIQGPAVRRAGTRFVAEIKDSTKRAWLVKFEFNVTQAYALEFGDGYIRFFTNHGQVLNGAAPLEIASPYSADDLVGEDGTFAISYAQSADVIYLFHASFPPQKLQRMGALSWNIVPMDFKAGPLDKQNQNQAANISIGTSLVEAFSGFDVFTADMVGTLLYLESADFSVVPPWEPGKQIAGVGENPNGLLRRVDQRVYKCVTSETAAGLPIWTGTETPTHTSGVAWDGDGNTIVNFASHAGVQWQFLHPGYAVYTITSFVSARHVGVQIQSDWEIPGDYITDTPGGTWRWAFGRWSPSKGWPDLVTFFRNRLVAARKSDQALDFSVAADYENFQKDLFGDVTADMAISVQVAADQEFNELAWLFSSDQLLIGSAGGEYVCAEQTTNDVFGPDNIKISKQTSYGGRSINPIDGGSAILFVQKGGLQLMEMQFNIQSNNFDSDDKSVFSDHLMIGGLTQMAHQRGKDGIVWCTRADGALVGFTYSPKQDVSGWAPYPLGGTDVVVESILVLPAPTLDRFELWLIVSRTIGGTTKRYVEYMERPIRRGDTQASAFYVDCGLTYNGTPATTISGLDHLEGQTVAILTDGATHPDRTVTGGQIELQEPGSVVNVGLKQTCRLTPMRIDAGAADGTAQGKTKRITKVVYRFDMSLGGKYGVEGGPYDEILTRSPNNNMDQAPPLLTGDSDVLDWPGGYDNDGVVEYVNDQPLPVTIVAIMPQVVTQDR